MCTLSIIFIAENFRDGESVLSKVPLLITSVTRINIRDHILLDERERYLAYGIPSKYLQQLQPSLLFYQRGYTDVLVMWIGVV